MMGVVGSDVCSCLGLPGAFRISVMRSQSIIAQQSTSIWAVIVVPQRHIQASTSIRFPKKIISMKGGGT